MHLTEMIDGNFPEGSAFLDRVAELEGLCARNTREYLTKPAKKAPACHDRFGVVLSLLYREASCFYGCPKTDHLGQRIAGRLVSHAVGSYRLLCSGYYDESLALTRNLGELANLFWLFAFRPLELERWRQADKKTRTRDFSPVRVRLAIESAGLPVPIDESRYAGLCDVAVHVGPATAPQAHNQSQISSLGTLFKEASFLASLNELAAATGTGGAALIPLLTLGDRKQRLKEANADLLRSVGGVDLAALRRGFDSV